MAATAAAVVPAAPAVAKGGFLTNLGAKTVAVMMTPAFGVIALAGVIGWQLWKARKDAQEIAVKKAAA